MQHRQRLKTHLKARRRSRRRQLFQAGSQSRRARSPAAALPAGRKPETAPAAQITPADRSPQPAREAEQWKPAQIPAAGDHRQQQSRPGQRKQETPKNRRRQLFQDKTPGKAKKILHSAMSKHSAMLLICAVCIKYGGNAYFSLLTSILLVIM